MKQLNIFYLACLSLALFATACNSDCDYECNVDGDFECPTIDGDTDQSEAETEDGDIETTDGDADAELTETTEEDLEQEIAEWQIPDSLPIEFTRADVGEELSDAEITAFTKKLTGAWKDIGYFNWILWTSHGMHESNEAGALDYKLYWQDTWAEKAGDKVTFHHTGGADNLTLRTSKVLNQAISGYLASGDEKMGRIVEQYSKGLVALFKGMVWGNEDPAIETIMARAIFTTNHEYVEDGKSTAIDYDPVKQEVVYSWNASTIPVTGNPYWEGTWARTMRSKDDVPHLYRSIPYLELAARDAKDENVKAAAQQALEYVKGFAKDIVDHGYLIRTKEGGDAFVPIEKLTEGGQPIYKDLASFINFDIEGMPDGECNAKLTSAILSYQDELGLDCKDGFSPVFEPVAVPTHYFNLAIINYFHLSVITNMMTYGLMDQLEPLMKGLEVRVNKLMYDEPYRTSIGAYERLEYNSDMAAFLVAAGAAGLPLTSDEARLIHDLYSKSVDHYSAWPNWDLWDASVADGRQDYKPTRDVLEDGVHVSTVVRPEEFTFLMEYCYSPFKNESGVKLVDCDVVLDPSRWGE